MNGSERRHFAKEGGEGKKEEEKTGFKLKRKNSRRFSVLSILRRDTESEKESLVNNRRSPTPTQTKEQNEMASLMGEVKGQLSEMKVLMEGFQSHKPS